MNQPSTLSFQFRHALFPVNVEIKNDLLCVRYAIKYFEIPITSLEYIYVDDDVNREMRELILCFRTPRDRVKRARIFSDRDQPAFDDLVQTLSLRVGEGHLTNIDRGTAYEIMGARSLEHIMIPALLFGVVFFIGLMLAPRLIHSWDDGPKSITVHQLNAASLTHHYVEIRDAKVDLNTVIFGPMTPTDENPLEGQWHPIHGEGTRHSEVTLIGYFSAKLETPSARPVRLSGLIRNIGFERIPAQVRVALESQGVVLAPNAVYLDVGATPSNDLYFFLMVMGPLSLFAIGIVVSLRRNRARNRNAS